jgi:proteic killer suppression protein
VEVYFDDHGLERTWESDKELRKEHGINRAKKIKTRRSQLRAAVTLADLRYAPGRWHELTANKDGLISADLDGPYRLLMRPRERQTCLKDDRSLDWGRVTAVVVEGIDDTHTR